MRNKRSFIFVYLIVAFIFSTQYVYAQENANQPSVPAVASPDNPVKNPAVTASSSQGNYSGADKCKGCHPTEFNDFEKRKFNKAWKILKMRGEEKNAECLKCHVTGYGQGGFSSEEKTPHLVGKQCEACHGPAGKHVSNPSDAGFKKQMDIGEKKNVCLDCHACMTTHKTKEF